MADVRVTLDEAVARGRHDPALIDATSETDIRRHVIEDGDDPNLPLPPSGRVVLSPAAIRAKAGLSDGEMARALRIPLDTWQAWEAAGWGFDPVVRTLLDLVAADPDRAFAALADRDVDRETRALGERRLGAALDA